MANRANKSFTPEELRQYRSLRQEMFITKMREIMNIDFGNDCTSYEYPMDGWVLTVIPFDKKRLTNNPKEWLLIMKETKQKLSMSVFSEKEFYENVKIMS